LYKNWVLGVEVGEGRFLTTDLLIQLASQFRIIKGLTAYFGYQGHYVYQTVPRLPVDKALVHLNSTHPELENVSLYRGTCTQI